MEKCPPLVAEGVKIRPRTLPTTLAASVSDGGFGVQDIKRTEGAGVASSHSLPNSGARCLSCRQSPVIKKTGFAINCRRSRVAKNRRPTAMKRGMDG
jgi:hypothetical protein